MATLGQECYHQSPSRNYFDSDYDLLFDAAVEQYCARFREWVVPARRCGATCPGFQPLSGASYVPRPSLPVLHDTHAHDERVRAFLQRALRQVCAGIANNAAYLERQLETRERRWREADEWLRREDTQPEMLGHVLMKEEQGLAKALSELQRVAKQLSSVKTGQRGAQDLERLWLEQERWEGEVHRARQARQRAEAIVIERSKREAEQEQLYARWEDAVERVPLLKRLRGEVERCVDEWLAGTGIPVSDANIEGIQRFLKKIVRFADDDVPIAALRRAIDELSRWHLSS